MSNVLLLDCSDVNLTVGVVIDDKLVYSTSFYAWQRQSEYLIPEIQKALDEVKLTLKDIQRVVLGIGPGSYTGVRIPLTIAKTLSVITNAEIVPLSSLQIMGTKEESYISLMNARSKRSYIGIYENGEAVVADSIIENDKLMDFIKPYLKKGFVVKGSVDYLGFELPASLDLIAGLYSYRNEVASDNPKAICPVYLKD